MEALQERLGGLLRERERLRTAGDAPGLEENRRAIVQVQQQLARAFIARFAA